MNMNEIEQLKRLIVEPMIATVEEKLKSHVEQVSGIVDEGMNQIKGLDTRVKSLESAQTKALWGWGAISVGISVALTAAWNYLKSKVRFS